MSVTLDHPEDLKKPGPANADQPTGQPAVDLTYLGRLDANSNALFYKDPHWDRKGYGSAKVQEIESALHTFDNSFKNQFGRNATDQELNDFAKNALFHSWTTSNVGDYGTSTALANTYINNNFDVAKMQADKGKSDAASQHGTVDQAFQTVFGRGADDSEKQHFGQLLSNGSLDAYSLNQWLQQTPESVRKQDADFRAGLNADLQKQDSQYFSEQIAPAIQSQFAAQGRDPRSSGYAAALAQAATQQNRGREAFTSNLTASQYMGNRQNAYNDYLGQVGRYYGNQDYSRARAAQMSDASTNRLYDVQNFNMQQDAYNQYLAKYGKRSRLGGALTGAAGGAMAGASFGPLGALAGGVAGGAAGYFG